MLSKNLLSDTKGYTSDIEDFTNNSSDESSDESSSEDSSTNNINENLTIKTKLTYSLAETIAEFSKKIEKTSRKRKSHDPELINRRLDSLARLLEQRSICAAVYFSQELNTIFIATNTIYDRSRSENNWIKQIEAVISLIAECKIKISDLIVVLADIISINFIAEERHLFHKNKNLTSIQDYIIILLSELFTSGYSTKDWKDQRLKKPPRDEPFAKSNALYSKLIKKISRIARDFLKLRDLLHNQIPEDKTFTLFFNALSNKNYTIIKSEKEKVHAEMRIASHIWQKKSPQSYIGISKLCCAHCNLAVEAISSAQLIEIGTRGQHGQCYDWTIPSFIMGNNKLLASFLGKKTLKKFETLSNKDKKKFFLEIQKKQISNTKENARHGRIMIADSSESDIEFGVSCDYDSELEEIAMEKPTNEISQVRELIEDYSEEYNRLRNIGFTTREILELYQKFEEEKFRALASEECIDLIKDESDPEETLAELSDIFDKDETIFDKFINDEGNILCIYTFKEALEKVKDKINTYNPDNPYDSDDADPYEQAARELNEENMSDVMSGGQNSEGNFEYPGDRTPPSYSSFSHSPSEDEEDEDAFALDRMGDYSDSDNSHHHYNRRRY